MPYTELSTPKKVINKANVDKFLLKNLELWYFFRIFKGGWVGVV